MTSDGKSLGKYLFATFALGWACQMLSAKFGQAALLLAMWAPTISLITISRMERSEVWKSLRRFSLKWLPFVILGPIAPYLIKQFLVVYLQLGTFRSDLLPIDWTNHQVGPLKNMGLILGTDIQTFGFFAANILATLIVGGAAIGIMGGIGEELGWRSYLQGRLEKKYGQNRGLFYLWAIWSYWHIPANLGGYNGSSEPYLVTFLLFPLGIFGLTLILAAIYVRTGSVWLCAIFHGMNNISNNLKFTSITNSIGADLLEGCILLLFGLLIWTIFSKRGEEEPRPSTHMG